MDLGLEILSSESIEVEALHLRVEKRLWEWAGSRAPTCLQLEEPQCSPFYKNRELSKIFVFHPHRNTVLVPREMSR